MPYRSAADRSEMPEEEGATAVFRVRHRSWTALAFAGLVGVGALALALACLSTDRGSLLAAVGMLSPTVLLGFAVHLAVGGAAEVDLRVVPTLDRSAVRVALRRRWGFFPWTPPLVFIAPKAPTLDTHWAEGRYSSRYGRGRRYEHACLSLGVGAARVRLPTMRGPRSRRGEVVVVDHAPAVLSAQKEYEAGLARVRAALGKAKNELRRQKQRDHSAAVERLAQTPMNEPATLVRSCEGAAGRAAWLGAGAAIVLPAALALVAFSLPPTRLGVVCAALVAPLFAGIVGVVATATSHGRTLHLRRAWTAHASIAEVSDFFLFGPILQTMAGAAHYLEDGFEYRIDRIVSGDEEIVSYALVVVATGRTLTRDADEELVRRYAQRLGGRAALE